MNCESNKNILNEYVKICTYICIYMPKIMKNVYCIIENVVQYAQAYSTEQLKQKMVVTSQLWNPEVKDQGPRTVAF